MTSSGTGGARPPGTSRSEDHRARARRGAWRGRAAGRLAERLRRRRPTRRAHRGAAGWRAVIKRARRAGEAQLPRSGFVQLPKYDATSTRPETTSKAPRTCGKRFQRARLARGRRRRGARGSFKRPRAGAQARQARSRPHGSPAPLGPHHRAPERVPAQRLATPRDAVPVRRPVDRASDRAPRQARRGRRGPECVHSASGCADLRDRGDPAVRDVP